MGLGGSILVLPGLTGGGYDAAAVGTIIVMTLACSFGLFITMSAIGPMFEEMATNRVRAAEARAQRKTRE